MPFDQVEAALRSKFEDVSIREAESLGPEDNYEEWRAGWKRSIAVNDRAHILRALQGRRRLSAELSRELFERAASVPIESEAFDVE
ncbi:MAG TPA: hypothetical protein VGM43_19580 [Bryobacteraceae bacterium]